MNQNQLPNANLTQDDYRNLINILDTVEIKGRKSAEYIAILGMKLDLRVKNWFAPSPIGFDILAIAQTSEAFDAMVKAKAKTLADAAIKARDQAILEQQVPQSALTSA